MNIKYISDQHRGLRSSFVAAQECPLQADVQNASGGLAKSRERLFGSLSEAPLRKVRNLC